MIDLIEQSRMAIDELIDVMGRASVEAVLELSARQVAGEPQQGKARTGDVGWHGKAGRTSAFEGTQAACAASAIAQERAWRRWRGGGAGPRGDASGRGHGTADVGDLCWTAFPHDATSG